MGMYGINLSQNAQMQCFFFILLCQIQKNEQPTKHAKHTEREQEKERQNVCCSWRFAGAYALHYYYDSQNCYWL